MVTYDSKYYGFQVLGQNSLMHHGILGMKWGVRRYQNKDGTWTAAGRKHRQVDVSKATGKIKYKAEDDLRIKKGTHIYRISEHERDSGDVQYVTYRNNDRNFYKGFWTERAKKENGAADVYEQSFKTTEDLKIPSRNIRTNILTQLSKDKEVVNSIRSLDSKWFDAYWDKAPDNVKAQTVASAIATSGDIKNKYSKKLLDLGYNAIVDDNSQSVVNEMPLIVLTAGTTLEYCGSTKVSDIDASIARSAYDYMDAMAFKKNVSTLLKG